MTTAITTTHASAIEPSTMDELRALAVAAATSKFYGTSSPEQALMLLMTGRDLGLSYAQSLRAFHVVQGRPVLSAAGMVAVCLRSGVCEHFRTVESTDTVATVEVKRRGDPARRVSFSLDDAKRAGLANRETWKAYPSRMLLARAQAWAAREVFPDLLLGLYDEDEVAAPARPVATPARVVETVVEPVVEVEAVDYASAIAAADTLEQLSELGAELRRAALPAAEKARYRAAFLARREALEAALVAAGVNLDAEPALQTTYPNRQRINTVSARRAHHDSEEDGIEAGENHASHGQRVA
jgi:hypothetical protein